MKISRLILSGTYIFLIFRTGLIYTSVKINIHMKLKHKNISIVELPAAEIRKFKFLLLDYYCQEYCKQYCPVKHAQ